MLSQALLLTTAERLTPRRIRIRIPMRVSVRNTNASRGFPSCQELADIGRPAIVNHWSGDLDAIKNIHTVGSQSAPVTFGRSRKSRRKRKKIKPVTPNNGIRGGKPTMAAIVAWAKLMANLPRYRIRTSQIGFDRSRDGNYTSA